ncbi:unnamed protein product [Trichobilharzia regenti]|nr:unnamed protein product [Trichobilharzia regenti]
MQRMNTLFSNTGVIYVGSDTNPPRQDLVDLLSLGGAVVSDSYSFTCTCLLMIYIYIYPSFLSFL